MCTTEVKGQGLRWLRVKGEPSLPRNPTTATATTRPTSPTQGLDELLAGFTAILSGCAVLLRPGGLAVVTTLPWRQHGELVDLPAAVLAAGARAGLVPVAPGT